MRAAAKIKPLGLTGTRIDVAVAGQSRACTTDIDIGLIIFGHLASRLFNNQLELIRLVGKRFLRLISRLEREALEPLTRLDDLLHTLFDALEILRRERFIDTEVVVETIVDGRANAQLRSRELQLHGLSHHVSRRVANDIATVRSIRRNGLEDGFRFWLKGEILQIAFRVADTNDGVNALVRETQVSHRLARRNSCGHGKRCWGCKFF